MRPHTAYHGNWQTNTERMPRLLQPGVPAGPGNHWDIFFTEANPGGEGSGLANLIPKCQGPVISVYTLNTPDLVLLPRETRRGGMR